MVKRILLEVLDFYRYKIVNDQCTESDMKSAFDLISNKTTSDATISYIARYYNQSESNVRNVISRHYIGKPKRKILYDFMKIVKVVPSSWVKK